MIASMRVRLLAAAAVVAFCFAGAASGAAAQEKAFSVITLGTGAPPPSMDRFGPAVLVIAGDQRLLFDAGRGVTQRLWQTRTAFGTIKAHFLTHLHSDHVVGLPDLWLMGWLDSPFGGRKTPLKLFGPKGTAQLAEGLQHAYAWDIEHRTVDQKLGPDGAKFDVKEIDEGLAYDDQGVKVTAFSVDHGEHLTPAFGYRIDFDGRSVVISGDTRRSENLIRHSQNANLLIHAVAMVKDELLSKSEWYRDILAHHTTPSEVGDVFAKTKPKMAALIHFVLLGDKGVPAPTLDDVTKGVRQNYQGPLTISQDLMRFNIKADGVTVTAPK